MFDDSFGRVFLFIEPEFILNNFASRSPRTLNFIIIFPEHHNENTKEEKQLKNSSRRDRVRKVNEPKIKKKVKLKQFSASESVDSETVETIN